MAPFNLQYVTYPPFTSSLTTSHFSFFSLLLSISSPPSPLPSLSCTSTLPLWFSEVERHQGRVITLEYDPGDATETVFLVGKVSWNTCVLMQQSLCI